ncbi:MAG: hypothetical protein AAGA23_04480 [Pseudomonadota bacterium]
MKLSTAPALFAAAMAATTPRMGLAEAHTSGFLYGKVVTTDGDLYEGRLRFGGDEEVFWNHYFIGRKAGNRWADHVEPAELLENRPVKLLGLELGARKRMPELRRPLMVAFGDVKLLEAQSRQLSVTLKNGTRYELDRYEADDFADGLRVWDSRNGIQDLDEWSIRRVEFMPTPLLTDVPERLHGVVRTSDGDFTGTIQWNRDAATGEDLLRGERNGDPESISFAQILRVERVSAAGARITLRDGQERMLSGGPDIGANNRGIDVDDPRFGRVSVSWNAFEQAEFSLVDSGPGYEAFVPGKPLRATVETRDGQTRTGRLVFDLDEDETTDTLDAPAGLLHYTIPFGHLASVAPATSASETGVEITLRSGHQLRLDRAGDLSEQNAGLLVFGAEDQPAYLAWAAVKTIRFEARD